MSGQNNSDPGAVDEDPWATPSGSGSAFSQPNVIDAEDSILHEEGAQGDDPYHEESAGNGTAATAKSKPNIAILGLAGLLVIGVIGGAGFIAKQKLFPDRQPRERVAVISPQDLVLETAPPGNVFDAPVAARPAPPASATNVFDSPVEVAKPDAKEASPVTVTVSGSDSATLPLAAQSQPAKPAGVTVTVNVPPTEPPVASKAAALVVPSPETKTEPAPPTPAVKAEPVARPASEKAPAKAKASITTAKAPKPVRKPVTRVASDRTKKVAKSTYQRKTRVATGVARAAVARAEPKETFVLPRGLKVQSIYPQTGANAQAWLTDGSGRTEVVSKGDTLRSGAQVIQIVAEKGQVITTSGVITTRGIN